MDCGIVNTCDEIVICVYLVPLTYLLMLDGNLRKTHQNLQSTGKSKQCIVIYTL